MTKIKMALLAVIAGWLGIDSSLDASGKALAIIDMRTGHPIRVLHHRWMLHALRGKLKERIPFVRRKPEEEIGIVVLSRDHTHVRPVQQVEVEGEDDTDFSMAIEGFEEFLRRVREEVDGSATDDPRADRFFAINREISKNLGVDLGDEGQWRSAMLMAYAVFSVSMKMEAVGIRWPPPHTIAQGCALTFTRNHDSLAVEGELPDLDLVTEAERVRCPDCLKTVAYEGGLREPHEGTKGGPDCPGSGQPMPDEGTESGDAPDR